MTPHLTVDVSSRKDTPCIENLVLQGVGVRSVAFVGSIKILREQGHLHHLKRIAGVSSGAIIAALYALQYSDEQIKTILFDLDFSTFRDKPCLLRLKTKFAYFKGKKIEDTLKQYISKSPLKLDSDATFEDLQHQKGIELYIFAANLNTYSIQEFSARKTPDVKIWEAVRASIAIPLVFSPWKFTQGVPNQHLYIDGGIIVDFPIQFFDMPPFQHRETINNKTIGLLINNKAINRDIARLNYGSSFKLYLKAMYQMIVDGQTSVTELNVEEKKRIISIAIDEEKEFDLQNQDKQDLFDQGVKHTQLFLNSHSSLTMT